MGRVSGTGAHLICNLGEASLALRQQTTAAGCLLRGVQQRQSKLLACAQASEDEGSPDGNGGEGDGGSAAKAKPLKKAILIYPGDKAPGKARVFCLLSL